MSDQPYNPLDMTNLGVSVANALLSTSPTRMDLIRSFKGAGVYAIYYTGDAEPYRLLGDVNRDDTFAMPIYVGKAVPQGSRKGLLVATETNALSSRLLGDHRKSITQATNLNVEDFWARWLVTEPVWIPLGESLMIGRFAPVWNSLVDGFGNHAPGSGRGAGALSRWDTLHPGRNSIPRGGTEPVYWADAYPARAESPEDIRRDVEEYLRVRLQV